MPDRLVGAIDNPSSTSVAEVLTQERPSMTIATTLTADPGSSGTTLAITSAARFPTTQNYKVRVENEIMLVTGGAGTTSWTVIRGIDGTTAATHASGVTVSVVAAAQYVIPVSNRSVSYCGAVASWRTLGNAASPQNLFTIENAAGSNVIVGVSRLTVEMDATAALLAVAPSFKTFRPTALPSGGTTLTKSSVDTGLTTSASVVCRGATASDGGTATAITATAPAQNPMWHQFQMRMATQVGMMATDDFSMLPNDIADVDWITLRAGEALLLQVVGTAASNAATNHYIVKCAWFEYSLP